MANLFVNLPALASDGAGAWVDVSAFGGLKTIVVEPNGSRFSPFVTIECSNQDTPTSGYPLTTFQQSKDQTFEVACHWMRANTSNYKGGGAPTVSVGGTDAGTSSAQLPVPIGAGPGTAIDTSALENLKTVQVAGMFGGTVNVLVSEDGGASYNNAFSFQGGVGTAFQTAVIVADFMRVERVGVPMVAPGSPVVWVSATAGGGGGGGGGGGVDVDQDGVLVVTAATTLNFVGATVTDDGGGEATITIPEGSQTGRYTATGDEDSDGFPIVFADLTPPITIANVDYNAIVTGGGQTFVESFDCPVADYTTVGLTVVPSAELTDGDVLIVTLVPLSGGGGGGGGGGAGIDVAQDGIVVVPLATTLNFVGATVTDDGGGEATIAIDAPEESSAVPVLIAAVLTSLPVDVLLYSPTAPSEVVIAIDFGEIPATGSRVTIIIPAVATGSADLFTGGVLAGTAYPFASSVSTMLPGQSLELRFDGAAWQPLLAALNAFSILGNSGTAGELQVGPPGSNSSSVVVGGDAGTSEMGQLIVGHLNTAADIRAGIVAGPGDLDISESEALPSNTLITNQTGVGVLDHIITSIGAIRAGYKYMICVLGGTGSVVINNQTAGVGKVYIPGAATSLTLTIGQFASLDYDETDELGFGVATWAVMATNGVVA